MSHGIPVGLDELLKQRRERSLDATRAQTQALRDLTAEINRQTEQNNTRADRYLHQTRGLADLLTAEIGMRDSAAPTGKHYHPPSQTIDPAPRPKPTLMQRIRAWLGR